MRRAFIMGSNGPEKFGTLSKLNYAIDDVNKITKCLKSQRCGFQVDISQYEIDTFAVLRQLTEVAATCQSGDTFICYFSGHGYLHKGKLYLLWNHSDRNNILGTTLPITRVMEVLNDCDASDKLLILDCCHAGAAVGLKSAGGIRISDISEIKKPTSYQMLLASERIDAARELHELGGGFLTSHICSALDDKFYEADKDRDGQLTVQELQDWLKEKAEAYNQKHSEDNVPLPFLFGRGDFSLTNSNWEPYLINWVDGSEMIVLPIKPKYGMAQCISRYPITNYQYNSFFKNSRVDKPTGENFLEGKWVGPFIPWDNDDFNENDKPVVCVSYQDAKKYCEWVNDLISKKNSTEKYFTKLPDPALWDFASYGSEFPASNPELRMKQTQFVHHKSSVPAKIDLLGKRRNLRGISDMFGNVWEWCYALNEKEVNSYSLNPFDWVRKTRPEIRGGGFFDDISQIQTFLDSKSITDHARTRHSDLGFRIAAEVSVDILPEDLKLKLRLSKPSSKILWLSQKTEDTRVIQSFGGNITASAGKVAGDMIISNIAISSGFSTIQSNVFVDSGSIKPKREHFKLILKRLETIIEDTTELYEDDRKEALYHVSKIIKAVEKPLNENLQREVKTSVKMLMGTIALLPADSEITSELRNLIFDIYTELGLKLR